MNNERGLVEEIISLCRSGYYQGSRKAYYNLCAVTNKRNKKLLDYINIEAINNFNVSNIKAAIDKFIEFDLDQKKYFRTTTSSALDISDIKESYYYSCEMLEGGISLFNSDIKICCIMPPFQIYNETNIGVLVEQIYYLRKRIVSDLNNGKPVYCVGCPYLTKKNWPDNEYLIMHIDLAFTNTCNLRCRYCGTTINNRHNIYTGKRYTHYGTIKTLLDEKYIGPKTSFDFGSEGETTLIENFNPILQELLDHGLKGGNIMTNSTIYSPTIFYGLQNCLLSIETSIDAGTAEGYKNIRGRDLFHKVVSNLKRYSSANDGKGISLKYIFLDDNASENELVSFVDLISTIKHEKVIITNDYNSKKCSKKVIDGIRFLASKLEKKSLQYILHKPSFSDEDYREILQH